MDRCRAPQRMAHVNCHMCIVIGGRPCGCESPGWGFWSTAAIWLSERLERRWTSDVKKKAPRRCFCRPRAYQASLHLPLLGQLQW
eukprot:12888276-Alexandrium_andersonii.AAC.1